MPTDQIDTTRQVETKTAEALGTKWLSFWNYFCLPVGALADVVMVFVTPHMFVKALCVVAFPLRIATAIALHQRRRWGWNVNCVMIG